MMHFVALFESPQNPDGRLHTWLEHHHRLKPAFERRVLFDVLAVFVQCRCPNTPQFAPRQRRLEQVRRVRCPFRRSRPHQSVKFIDEQNHALRWL
jgi:hypothetical protein